MKSAFLFLSTLATASVAPSANGKDSVEVIPGEGMPSLESLNLTSANLNDPDFFTKFNIPDPDVDGVHVLYEGQCDVPTLTPGPVQEAEECRRYLAALGRKRCTLENQGDGTYYKQFCRAGSMIVAGVNLHEKASSYCRDVASGVGWVIDHCTNNNMVKGGQAAGGNGDLILAVTKK